MTVADSSTRSTLLNVSKRLDLFFCLVFLPQAKHFSSFMIPFDLWRILISEGSSYCSSTVISVEISYISFVCCFNILFNLMSFVKIAAALGGWNFTVSFSNNSAVIVLHLSRMRWKFWKLDGRFSTAVQSLVYSLTFLKPSDVIVGTFSLTLKWSLHNQQTPDFNGELVSDFPFRENIT